MKPYPKKYTKKDKRDKKYLEWIKTQPCCNPNCPGNCGDIVPAHMSILGGAGMATKAPDKHALPLGHFCHMRQHFAPVSFWGSKDFFKTKDFVQKLCDKHLTTYLQRSS